MVVGSYLISSTHMRIHDRNGSHFIGLPNGPPPIHGRLTPSTLKERVQLVFELPKEKMKNLVIVNSSLSYFEMVQACVEVAEKYADNVMVVPPLLALLTYAFEDLSKYRNPPANEVLLVVTITSKFADFVTLRRDQNFKLYVAEFDHFDDFNRCKEMFPEIYNYCYPHSTILLVHDTLYNIAEEIRSEFNPENCFIKRFKKWDFLLLLGALFRAMDDDDGFDTRYHIANFSSGFETVIQNRRTQTQDRHILLPDRSALPCTIHGYNGIGQIINVFYSPQYYQIGNELISLKRPAIKHTICASGKFNDVLGYVDERGIPYAKDSNGFKKIEISNAVESKNQNTVQNDVTKSSQNLSNSDTIIFSHPSTSTSGIVFQPSASATTGQPQIKFLFCDNFFAIEVLQNDLWELLQDPFGNVWTSLYFSMAESTVQIGEKAKTHYETFPKHVIFGNPLNQFCILKVNFFQMFSK
jgi:hypothetical protein